MVWSRLQTHVDMAIERVVFRLGVELWGKKLEFGENHGARIGAKARRHASASLSGRRRNWDIGHWIGATTSFAQSCDSETRITSEEQQTDFTAPTP